MLTPADTPTALDVLRLHQAKVSGTGCSCGAPPVVTHSHDTWLAGHQLGVLQASDLAVVSVHGTAGVVLAATALVAATRVAAGHVNLQPTSPAYDAHARQLADALEGLQHAVVKLTR